MPKTLQYPTWASRPRDANYDVLSWGVAAANPGTTASVTVETGFPQVMGYTVLLGIVGQNGVTYTITSPSAGSSRAVVSRDGAGTHAEIRYDLPITPGGPGSKTTYTVTASSSVKFGIIVIVFNCEMLATSPQVDQVDSNVDAPGTSHLSGATGFTTSGNGSFTLAIGCPSSDPGAITYDPKYVGLPSSNGLVIYQCASRDAPNSIANTQASFTTANSVAECTNVMATFTVKSTPASFTTAIQPQPTTITYPRRVADPGWFTGPVAPVVSPTVPPTSWIVQQPDVPQKPKPVQQGWFCDPTEPTLFVPQNLGWYQQQPNAPPKTKEAQPGWFTQPLEPTLFKPFSIGWYVQHPVAPPKTKVPDPGWFTEPIVVPPPPAVAWGWYTQHPGPIQYKRPLAESYFVMPTVLLNFNGIANVFDVHLVTPAVSNVNLIVPVTTSTTLQEP